MGQVQERIEQFAEEIRAEGVEGDRLMRLTDTSAKRLRESGAIRMLQPKQHGGLEVHPREFAETVMSIAAMDGAAGWVTGIVGVHPWELAFADPKVQEEIWGADQDTWVASPYAPMGVAKAVDGGYVLNGRWSFSSGTDHCQWAFLGALLGDENGAPVMPPVPLHVILPRSDYQIVADSWDVIGLRGTGSKDLIVKDAFIPSYRTMLASEVMDGTAVKKAGRTETLYNMPFSCMFPLGITSAVVGIAEGALACHIAAQKDRVAITGTRIKEDPYVLYAIGEAAAEIAASRAALLETVDRFWDMTEAGKEVDFEARAIGRRTQTAAAWRAVRAVDEIFARSGGGALHYKFPMQRFFRDAHAGIAHAIHVPGSIFHSSALTQLGGEPQGIHRAMI
ncbi:3-hydroxy-9,10-secoandrosta-1,3,5(10)-triene-9,17-dione monooxygenase [Rhodococcus sp. PvR044]|jgi:3-hydroxy-9,10-secoandrosta-1,3,5(10)-triene-9,17-dione monooxygenase|uniref:Hydroxylase n=1 Tax=Rhodococcus oryzae TaxID=2571143 RepID=A0ABY2RPB2_9NOCA|nr:MULTISPECIES: hydroxylase [Rhodococcus]MBP1161692.1 alkylation response protein AidB-like acyl-CoA dehydrogenase [Rhodococcus sp. PvR099]MCZ4555678.1 hydroxylase [Rhodococcus maanshanensis]PTR38182.1 alkylation response protein AidB-like acyl-CoA dehydrogenase [Rhodococcus sp. OK611]TJZ80256.1 hydroxylase [Rhodococcus oryzae]SNX93114.1 Acyl-CoA dehydrogenase [Rhodococcus sp. OK270]